MHRRGWSKPAQADHRSTTAPAIGRVFFHRCEIWKLGGWRRGAVAGLEPFQRRWGFSSNRSGKAPCAPLLCGLVSLSFGDCRGLSVVNLGGGLFSTARLVRADARPGAELPGTTRFDVAGMAAAGAIERGSA